MNTSPRNPKTALFLSLLVLPGTGHWYLGHKRLGSLFAAITSIALLYPLAKFTRTMQRAIEVALLNEASTHILSALQLAWQSTGSLILGGLAIIVIIWAIAAADVYRRTHTG